MTLVTLLGGARSGKSRLAIEVVSATGKPVTFVATGEARDEEMTERIAAHRRARPEGWTTIEEPHGLEGAVAAVPADRAAIVDCLSLWVANVLERGDPEDEIVAAAARAARAASTHASVVVAVSNEVGLGIVPMSPLGRAYRDLLGTVNRVWVEESAEAVFVVAGRLIPLLPAEGLVARTAEGGSVAAELAELIELEGVDEAVRAAAVDELDRKTKPRDSLGRIEELAVQVAAIRGSVRPEPLAASIVVAAADHGVAAEGVSAYPQEVTGQMVANFASGGAAICVLARAVGAELVVVDAGVVTPCEHTSVRSMRIGPGRRTPRTGPR